MTVTDWLISIAFGSVGGASIVGGLGYLFRARLAHWLNKDLEAVKAKHQRDLEQYKTQLVVEVERMKASNDVHKALALKIAEKRFAAIDELHRAFCGVSLGTLFTDIGPDWCSRVNRDKCLLEVFPLITRFDTAIHSARMFLTADESAKLTQLRLQLGKLSRYVASDDSEFTYGEFQKREDALDADEMACASLLKAHLNRLFQMTEAK